MPIDKARIEEKIAEWRQYVKEAKAWRGYVPGEEIVKALLSEREELIHDRDQAEHAAKVALAANEQWAEAFKKTFVAHLQDSGLTFEFRDGKIACVELDRALSLLREVEWSGTDCTCPSCWGQHPSCSTHSRIGHAPDCRLAAFLK